MPLAQWLNEWMTTLLQASKRAGSTKTMHAAYARVWIIPVLADVRLDQMNPARARVPLLVPSDLDEGGESLQDSAIPTAATHLLWSCR